ncbi:hypothetical protein CALVIDRAFT_95714 [Calocera viscosa TUFC12733]|uniref:Uncharacterized protein n=1 Tax=Calocera viscosa (strain TUFC12733) TaxID=1330018 RepID=A0A167MXB4_CALVF|nr:hypothetical protein CALVIDRAFT_95714 [Calocera viscosa TUFC12733]
MKPISARVRRDWDALALTPSPERRPVRGPVDVSRAAVIIMYLSSIKAERPATPISPSSSSPICHSSVLPPATSISTKLMSYIPPRTFTPSNDALYLALFHARIVNLHATAVQLHNIILANYPSWNISADRVLQLAHSSPELTSYPAVPIPSTPFPQRSLQLLFYLLSYYEQCFITRLSSDDAARWHPMRYEICLMAVGLKPCCVIWLGPGYHSSNRARHLQDRSLVDCWVANVWQRTVQKVQDLPNMDPAGLLGWLASVQTVPISAGVATGHPQDPTNWHSFTGRILIYSTQAPPHHRALVRWAFLQPNLVPGSHIVSRSPPSESVALLPESVIAAALGYPCTRPATRGLDRLRTACFFYEDFSDGRAVVSGFLAALPRDLSAVLHHLRLIQRILGPILGGTLNLGVRFEPNGQDQGEADAIHLQRLLTPSGQPLYTPTRPRNISMRAAYASIRDQLDPTLSSVAFRQSYSFSVYWATLQEVNVVCSAERLDTL